MKQLHFLALAFLVAAQQSWAPAAASLSPTLVALLVPQGSDKQINALSSPIQSIVCLVPQLSDKADAAFFSY